MGPNDIRSGERLVVPVHEEAIEPQVRSIETGSIRLHTRIETIPVEGAIDLLRDAVTVEGVRVDRPVDAVPEPWQEGETLVVPVIEEVLVTEKRLIVREEIRITRLQITEAVPVRDTVRREVVELERIEAPSNE